MKQYTSCLLLLLCGIVLSSCVDSEEDDLQAWMKTQRNEAKARVTPLAEPKKFKPQAYTEESLTDPFNILKLTQALKNDTPQKSNNSELVAPELNRRKEPLEAFPIDAMKMVGSVSKKGQPLALVKIDNLLYQVRVGNYLGPNYGRVTAVSENQVAIREIVQDAAGEWIERPVSLLLQESEK
jgi:type IV pilus assembly protein PilP